MATIIRVFTILASALFLISTSFAGNVNEANPYFLETGRSAIFQRSVTLSGGQVVLVLALEPGSEDLATIAYLKMALGAQVITAFVTNGDGTPSDFNGEAPFLLAARRKEEAYKANTFLGAEPYYLNLPDPGIISDRATLERIWNPDSAFARLARLMFSHRPDVVLIEHDFREPSAGPLRREALTELVLKAVEAARTEAGPLAWRVRRVLSETDAGEGPVRLDVRELNPVWKKSYETIGREAVPCYESLRAEMLRWSRPKDRAFAQVWPPTPKPEHSLFAGVTEGGRRVELLAGLIRNVVKGKAAFAPSLERVSAMIDSVDFIISHQLAGLTNQEKRWMVSWKNGLESLRCALLNVDIQYVLTDSLVSERQIFYIRFRRFKTKTGKKDTEIFFPGATNHEWVVNESLLDHFPFDTPKEFLVLTPETMEYNMPVSLYGLGATSLRTHFTFFVYRRGSARPHNFSYKADVVLRTGPRRTFQVLTPMVRAVNGEPVVFSLLNFSRDPFKGYIVLTDSLLGNVKKPVFLPKKDFVLNDTVRLELNRPVSSGDHTASLQLSGKGGIRPFIARAFSVQTDTGTRVALVSGIGGSPVTEALRRIGAHPILLGMSTLDSELDTLKGVLVIDREAVTLRNDLQAALPRIRAWVEQGGHLVVLPQYSADEHLRVVDGLDFRPNPALPPEAALHVDTTDQIIRNPNNLRTPDWAGWVVARAWGSIRVHEGVKAEIPIRNESTGDPLVAGIPLGKGWVTYVALDLSSQLMNIHPGAHRLLANLLHLK